jgi:nitrogen fixation NifU-like protein
MSEVKELYQELIVEHSKKPRNFGKLPEANHTATGYNPLCGDKVTVYVTLDGDRVRDIRWEGSGCAISTASASLMTERSKERPRAETDALFEIFHKLVTGGSLSDSEAAQLGKLAVFSGVKEFPVRVKCATLAWHTLRAALEGTQSVTTD